MNEDHGQGNVSLRWSIVIDSLRAEVHKYLSERALEIQGAVDAALAKTPIDRIVEEAVEREVRVAIDACVRSALTARDSHDLLEGLVSDVMTRALRRTKARRRRAS